MNCEKHERQDDPQGMEKNDEEDTAASCSIFAEQS